MIMITTEEKRKIAVKFIVYDNNYGGRYMCVTNWSGGYSAGVMEFNSEPEALIAAKDRTDEPVIHAYNEFGERIK
jgi:hypothetical protein